jgi:uncharacterized protein YndB with AHSA1/START domain
MAISVAIETDIARPREAVFAALADVGRWPAWLIATGIIRVARADTAALATGSRLTIDQQAAGRSSVVDAAVTVLEPPTRFAIAGKDADGISTTLEASLSTTADGGTRLRWTARIEVPFRYRMFESFVSPQVQKAATLDVEAFRRRLESASPD